MTNLQYFSLAALIVWSPVMGKWYRYLLVIVYLIYIAEELLR